MPATGVEDQKPLIIGTRGRGVEHLHRLGAVFLLVLSLGLGGCSTLSIAYNQSGTLTYWWLDGLVDFDRRQARQVRASLDELLAWHRQQRLPVILDALERLQTEVRRDATPEQACDWWQRLLAERDALLDQAAPATGKVAASLTATQRQHLERKFAQRDEDWRREHLQPEPEARNKAQLDRLADRLERLYGDLSREQTLWLGDQLKASPWDPALWLRERQAHQQQTLDYLRSVAETPSADPNPPTRRWLQRVFEPSQATVKPTLDRLTRHQCGVAAAFHNRTTPAQRQHAAEQLGRWIEDLSATRSASATRTSP